MSARTLLAAGVAACLLVAAPAEAVNLRARKSVTALTKQEREAFVDAVLALKEVPSPYDPALSYYDQFVSWHVDLYRCDGTNTLDDERLRAHGGPMFLPWHREFLLLFEQALQSVGGKHVTVPYWDWSDHSSVPSVFADDFIGGSGDPDEDYDVTTGPFRRGNWRLNVHPEGVRAGWSNSPNLKRRLGDPAGLPSPAEIDDALARTVYDIAPYDESVDNTQSFRNAIEGWKHGSTLGPSLTGCAPDGWAGSVPHPQRDGGHLHNIVHYWVGGIWDPTVPQLEKFGTMNLMSSPNDPVFFLHHANIDRLWARWQELHGTHTYLPRTDAGENGADDPLVPFDTATGQRLTPDDVESTRDLGYVYADAPGPPAPAAVARRAEGRLVCRLRAAY